MNLVLFVSPKCGQGGEGVKKSQNFADVIYGWPLGQMQGEGVSRLDPVLGHSSANERGRTSKRQHSTLPIQSCNSLQNCIASDDDGRFSREWTTTKLTTPARRQYGHNWILWDGGDSYAAAAVADSRSLDSDAMAGRECGPGSKTSNHNPEPGFSVANDPSNDPICQKITKNVVSEKPN